MGKKKKRRVWCQTLLGREKMVRKIRTIKICVLCLIEYCQVQKESCSSVSAEACLQPEWRLHTGSHSLCIGFLAQFLWWHGIFWSEPLHLLIPRAYLEQSKYPNSYFLNLLYWYNNPWNFFSTENLIKLTQQIYSIHYGNWVNQICSINKYLLCNRWSTAPGKKCRS